MGQGFLARDITFENTAGASSHQAVALRVGSDLSAFYRFVFQLCDILARRPNPHQGNMVTAQGRTDPQQNTGIVIQGCKIAATTDLEPVKANFKTYLGRPWKNYSRTVIMQSFISDVIDPKGWSPWDGDFALDTLYYREYRNWGPGADTSKRVKWKGWGVMGTPFEAMPFSIGIFINGWYWLPFTGFPFWLLF
ncbi:unnamed protein product [Lactuca saligna]|uniref:Pectinesterase catalytic domain-containing protein n=1 Tax=Lactuca saligna TaxID=75948 RepID=A0AA35VTR4_LACSI|nr:unnamed protein product [Lactuca saligna]